MVLPGLLVALLAAQDAVPKHDLTLQDGLFHLVGPEGEQVVPCQPKAGPLNQTAGRFRLVHDGTTVMYDATGFSLLRGKQVAKSTLAFVPTSGRLFSAEEVVANKAKLASGEYAASPAGLSGYAAIGDELYLLMRWETSKHDPWLEAILRIDLTQKKPVAQILGRFRGLTTAKGRVNDRMGMIDGSLAAMTLAGDGFGMATYGLSDGKMTYQALGPVVDDARLVPGRPAAVTITTTPAHTYQLGYADLETFNYRLVEEIRGQIVSLLSPGVIVYRSKPGLVLLNLETGAESKEADGTTFASLKDGLLAYSPAKHPHSAAWLSPGEFRLLATWTDGETSVASPREGYQVAVPPKPKPKKAAKKNPTG